MEHPIHSRGDNIRGFVKVQLQWIKTKVWQLITPLNRVWGNSKVWIRQTNYVSTDTASIEQPTVRSCLSYMYEYYSCPQMNHRIAPDKSPSFPKWVTLMPKMSHRQASDESPSFQKWVNQTKTIPKNNGYLNWTFSNIYLFFHLICVTCSRIDWTDCQILP